ncbi:MAG TPA: hypothetical protein VHG31_07455 [Stellaceae bacterium]|nr:hypothetical protein [Stellaceae bacterium]
MAVGPGDGPGCLGVTVAECVAWLRATMTLDESFLAWRHEVDVNGQPLGSGLVVVNGRLAEQPEQLVLLLRLGPGDTVRRVEANLRVRLTDARTEAVYDRADYTKSSGGFWDNAVPGSPSSTFTVFSKIR